MKNKIDLITYQNDLREVMDVYLQLAIDTDKENSALYQSYLNTAHDLSEIQIKLSKISNISKREADSIELIINDSRKNIRKIQQEKSIHQKLKAAAVFNKEFYSKVNKIKKTLKTKMIRNKVSKKMQNDIKNFKLKNSNKKSALQNNQLRADDPRFSI